LLLSSSEEVNLIGMLDSRPQGSLSVAEAIVLRKLKLQRVRVSLLFSLFFFSKFPFYFLSFFPALAGPQLASSSPTTQRVSSRPRRAAPCLQATDSPRSRSPSRSARHTDDAVSKLVLVAPERLCPSSFDRGCRRLGNEGPLDGSHGRRPCPLCAEIVTVSRVFDDTRTLMQNTAQTGTQIRNLLRPSHM
jgi:hypothetical protein